MDLVLNVLDANLLTPYVYPETWPEDDIIRQFISLLAVVNMGGYVLYLSIATLNFYFIFDHVLMKHPLFLKDQIRKEMGVALNSIPYMSLPTCVLFLLEVRGYSRLYDGNISNSQLGFLSIPLSCFSFLFFTDFAIYWIHRWLHHPRIYRYIHKTHHLWKVPTPFASHAFHPVDGFLQSVPYHVYPFLFPLHKLVYLVLFVFVNIWTVSIHDGDYRVPDIMRPYINGSAHHTDHHLFYNYNYGQYFTLWDRIGGSFRTPSVFEGKNLIEEATKYSQLKGEKKANGVSTESSSKSTTTNGYQLRPRSQ